MCFLGYIINKMSNDPMHMQEGLPGLPVPHPEGLYVVPGGPPLWPVDEFGNARL